MLIAYYRMFSSDKFHSYFFLIYKSGILIVYCVLYGAIAAALVGLLPADAVKVSGNLSKAGPWLYPLGIGLFTKGVSDLNLFNVRTDGTSIPVGLRTITQPIDKFFEEKLDGVSFKNLKNYIGPYYVKSRTNLSTQFANDLKVFKASVIAELKKYFNSMDRVAKFETSDAFGKVKSSDDVLYLALREFGKTIFESIFQK
jgi:hypothetical protein